MAKEILSPVKKLTRPKNGRMIAGVAAGMANYFGIDVTIVRLIWILVALPGGSTRFASLRHLLGSDSRGVVW